MKLVVDLFSTSGKTNHYFKDSCEREHVKILDEHKYNHGVRYLVNIERDGRIFLPCRGIVELPGVWTLQEFETTKPIDLMGLCPEV